MSLGPPPIEGPAPPVPPVPPVVGSTTFPVVVGDESPIVIDQEDDHRLRRWTIRSRLLALVVVGSLVLVTATAVAVAAVNAVAGHGRTVERLAEARTLNTVATGALRDVHERALGAAPTGGRDLDQLGAVQEAAGRQVTAALDEQGLSTQLAAAAAAADARQVQAARALAEAGGGADSAALATQEAATFAHAVRARTEVDAALAARAATERDRLDSARRTALVTVLVAAALGIVTLLVGGAIVLRSILLPLRSLGRAMRRFGDGDLRSRAIAGADEVGMLARSFNVTADGMSGRIRELSADAERGNQLRIIAEAIDLAADEPDVFRIVDHAMGILGPGRPIELLINDAESSRLRQVARNPHGGAPNCPVEDTTACVAIRRARTLTFTEPDSINACPLLRDRPEGPCSAVCIPINTGGTLVGVLHATGPVGDPPPPPTVEQLVILASEAGARIGSIRTLETSRVEATTDGLTGLANRRMLESTLSDLLRTSTPFVLVVADLDHFKSLNDTYGHELGDRALQLFAQVLSSNVRGRDLVARFGGEEFVLVYPEMNVQLSLEVLERIRTALARAVNAAGMPRFTSSFGVTHSSVAADVDGLMRIADAGLYMAKDLGRDRVVYSDADLAAEVFARDRNGNGNGNGGD